MAKVYLDDSRFQAIANAIRTKTGASATLLPSEMAAAITSIGVAPVQLKARARSFEDKRLRTWPGWEDSTWVDLKFIVDEWNMGRRELPDDILVGSYKLWPIMKGDKEVNVICKLNSIVDGTLIFQCASAFPTDYFALDEHLNKLYNMSVYGTQVLTDNNMFLLTPEKWNIDNDEVCWTSIPFVCITPGGELIDAEETTEFFYIPMFAIGNDLGGMYDGRYPNPEPSE